MVTKHLIAGAVLALIAGLMSVLGAIAAGQVLAAPPSPEVARLCRQRAIEAHPTQRPGAEKGHSQAQRDYFRDCVVKTERGEKLP